VACASCSSITAAATLRWRGCIRFARRSRPSAIRSPSAAHRRSTPSRSSSRACTASTCTTWRRPQTARQIIAEAADAIFPDAIFVLHAGILADLAIETGAPVVVHVSAVDLEAATARPSLKRLVLSAIGSSDRIVAADEAVAGTVAEWLGDDADVRSRCEMWPFDAAAAPRVAEACGRALARRRGDA